jgi:hypothetical protein
MQKTATVTLNETGLTYEVFSVSSHISAKTYAVWTINGNPVHCTCKDRHYRPWKLCQHMKDWQAEKRAAFDAEYDPCMVA